MLKPAWYLTDVDGYAQLPNAPRLHDDGQAVLGQVAQLFHDESYVNPARTAATTLVMLLAAEHLGDVITYAAGQHDGTDLARLIGGHNLIQAHLTQIISEGGRTRRQAHPSRPVPDARHRRQGPDRQPLRRRRQRRNLRRAPQERPPDAAAPPPSNPTHPAMARARTRTHAICLSGGQMTTHNNADLSAAADAPPSGLTRITFNLTARTTAALTTIMAASGDNNKTDAINNSLRVMATLLGLAHDDGAIRVIAPDATTHIVHLP